MDNVLCPYGVIERRTKMTIEKWVHNLYDGTTEDAYIEYNGIDYTVYSGKNAILYNTYKTYTWARKSLEKYGFELASTKIILGK